MSQRWQAIAAFSLAEKGDRSRKAVVDEGKSRNYTGNLMKTKEKTMREIQAEVLTEAIEKLAGIFETARISRDFGNGRYVRNVIEKAKMAQAVRLLSMDLDKVTGDDIRTICAADIEPPVPALNKERVPIGFCAA